MNNPNGGAAYSHFVTEVALQSCGFEPALRSSTPRQIWNIHPHGGTAMRDALIYGNNLMIQLHRMLQKEGTANCWSFLHILITDGHDTDSQASFQTTVQMLSTLRADLNVRDLKIVILGVDIEYSYAQQLRTLARAAGIHGEYHDITHTDIAHMFSRIRRDFGMGQRGYQQGPLNKMNMMPGAPNVSGPTVLGAQLECYAVLFTLDISGSMSGHKWQVTRHAVVDFIRYLGKNDIVSAIVFNDYPHLVMHWGTRQNQMKLGQLTGGMQPFGQIMTNQPYYDPLEFSYQQPGMSPMLTQPLTQQRYVVQDPYYNDQCCCNVM